MVQIISSPEGGTGPKYDCWLNLGVFLGGNLHGSPGSVKEWGRRMGSTVAQSLYLVLCLSVGSLLNVETWCFLHGNRHGKQVLKGNHQLWLFYLSERMKAVFLRRSWVCHSGKPMQVGHVACSPAFLALPCRLSTHACGQHVTASARPQLPPDLEGAGFCWPSMCFQQAGLFSKAGILLIFCVHVHISTRALSLLGCTQTMSTLEESQGRGCPPHCQMPHQTQLCVTPK